MTDGIMISIGADGVARMYDDTYDITIHCETQAEHDEAMKILQGFQWIPCTEKLPDSSEKVLCCDKYGEYLIGRLYEDDTSDTGYGADDYEDCKMWDCVAWMPLPKPWKGEDNETD